MLAVAFMQQKCIIIEMSDTIRRNEHTKICTGDNGDIGDIASFANIVMRFFYNNHVLIERRCLFAANLHSNVLPYEQGYLV